MVVLGGGDPSYERGGPVGCRVSVWRLMVVTHNRAFCEQVKRECFIDNLLVRIHFIIVMIRWTGFAPWEFQFPLPGSRTSTFLGEQANRQPSLHSPRSPRSEG